MYTCFEPCQINKLTYVELDNRCLVGILNNINNKLCIKIPNGEIITIKENEVKLVGDVVWTKLI